MIVYNIDELPEMMVEAAVKLRVAKEAALRDAFETAIKSNVFMSFEDKVDNLLNAMSIPISDDQSYNQFYIHSEKDLATKALMDAIAKQAIPVLPTADQIHAEALSRYNDKVAKEERKAAKKAAKEVAKQPAVKVAENVQGP